MFVCMFCATLLVPHPNRLIGHLAHNLHQMSIQTTKNLRGGNRKKAARSKRLSNTTPDGSKDNGSIPITSPSPSCTCATLLQELLKIINSGFHFPAKTRSSWLARNIRVSVSQPISLKFNNTSRLDNQPEVQHYVILLLLPAKIGE